MMGRLVHLVGASDERAVSKIQGSTLATAYVDEAATVPSVFWRMLLSRLSIPGAQLLATCNPEGPAHWLKKEFIDNSTLDLKHFHFTLYDNPSLDESYKENLKKEYTGVWYKRYILGEWTVAHGLVYDSLDEDNFYDESICNPAYYVAGLDYGTTNPTACVIAAINPNAYPQIQIIDEYYYDGAKHGRAKTDSELADDIKTFIGSRPVQSLFIDPAAASLKLELRRRDLPVVDALNDVVTGIKITSKFIAGKNLVIHNSCRKLKEELYGYAWDPKAADRGFDKPVKQNDHACVAGNTMIKIRVDGEEKDICIKDAVGLDCEVLSFCSKKGIWDFFFCKNISKTKKSAKVIKVFFGGVINNGKNYITVTPDHKIMICDRGSYIQARDLQRGQLVKAIHNVYRPVTKIEDSHNEDVYCMAVPDTGCFIGDDIVLSNCDSLRYACASAFPSGEIENSSNMNYDEIKRSIYGDDHRGWIRPIF
jgi:PBSX family phage terminase large subunit